MTLTFSHQIAAGRLDVYLHLGDDGQVASLAAALAPLLAQALGDALVSKLSDALTGLKASSDALSQRVATDVSGLTAQLATLQQTVEAGGATQADLDMIAAIKAQLDAVDPAKPPAA